MSFQKWLAKGEAACLRFDAVAIEKGYATAKPTVDRGYDRILDAGDKLYRIQIKSSESTNRGVEGSVYINLRRSRTHRDYCYTSDNIDALVVYVIPIGKFCWFEPNILEGKQSLVIRYQPSRNSQKKNCLFAEDYFWD